MCFLLRFQTPHGVTKTPCFVNWKVRLFEAPIGAEKRDFFIGKFGYLCNSRIDRESPRKRSCFQTPHLGLKTGYLQVWLYSPWLKHWPRSTPRFLGTFSRIIWSERAMVCSRDYGHKYPAISGCHGNTLLQQGMAPRILLL